MMTLVRASVFGFLFLFCWRVGHSISCHFLDSSKSQVSGFTNAHSSGCFFQLLNKIFGGAELDSFLSVGHLCRPQSNHSNPPENVRYLACHIYQAFYRIEYG